MKVLRLEYCLDLTVTGLIPLPYTTLFRSANPPVVGNSDPVSQPVGGGSDDPSGDDPIMPGGRHAGGHPKSTRGNDNHLPDCNAVVGMNKTDTLHAYLYGWTELQHYPHVRM